MTPERISSTHGPRLDDQLEHETKGLVDSGSGARAREDLEPEAPHADEGTAARSPEDDPVLARRELSRHVRMTVFPAGRDALVAEAEENQAPEWVRRMLASLPEGEEYGTVYEVWDAAGGELEPGVQELLDERAEHGEAHRP